MIAAEQKQPLMVDGYPKPARKENTTITQAVNYFKFDEHFNIERAFLK